MDEDHRLAATQGWWNGVNIIVHDPADVLARSVPATNRDRYLFENEHHVHAAKFGAIAPDAVFFVQSILAFKLHRAIAQIFKMGMKLRKMERSKLGVYERMNTFSRELPQRRFNSKIS